MPRIRSTKPEFWADYDTAVNLSRDARLLYMSLWNFCDEHARMPGDVRYVKGHCFPYDDDLDAAGIDGLLGELEATGKVVRYTVAGAPYLWLPSLHRHQRLEPQKVPSRLPDPPTPDPDGSGSRADESAPHPDSTACGQPAAGASSQVRPPKPVRTDESAPRADSSETISALQGAWSREHAAGSRDACEPPPQPVDDLPGEVEILRAKLEARKLAVRWDKLSPDQVTEIVTLVGTHGDGPLVKAAMTAYQPNDPIVFAQGWLSHWRELAPPGQLRAVTEPDCPHHPGKPGRSCSGCAADRLAGDA